MKRAGRGPGFEAPRGESEVAQDYRESASPRWRLTRWLVDPGRNVPEPIRASLFNSLYGSLPIFLGGITNTLLVSSVIAARNPTPLFLFWAGAEVLLAALRLPVLIAGQRAIREGRRGPDDLYILLALLWASLVGFGAFICLTSGDWIAATLACLSGGAMVGGICFRNFAAPRMAALMILLSLGPCLAGAILSGEPLLLATAIQIPIYLFAMGGAAFRMNRVMIARMQAAMAMDHRARHDDLTGLLNRAGLAAELEQAADGELAYYFLDLDGFKRVNDTLGHAAGDRLLVEIAGRMRRAADADDILVRLGGDEFLVIAPCRDRADACARAEALIETLTDAPYLLDGEGIEIGVSIGVALSREHGRAFAALIEAADQALYRAKASGRCRWSIATRTPQLAVHRRAPEAAEVPVAAAG